MAKDLELDLVEVVPTADPPVCRIVEYQKFLYDKKKKEKELKSKQGKQVVKEVRFGPNTDEHDFNFKVKHAMNFLEDGNKVKAFVIHKPEGSFQSALSWCNDIKSQVSYHYLIDKDGTIATLVPPENTAWHAGRVKNATWPGIIPNLNPNFREN
jgi:translation initiation factor IF-3